MYLRGRSPPSFRRKYPQLAKSLSRRVNEQDETTQPVQQSVNHTTGLLLSDRLLQISF